MSTQTPSLTPGSGEVPAPRAKSRRRTLYGGDPGMWSWVLHRITGATIFFFLFVHVLDTAVVRVSPRFIFDSRDEGAAERLDILNDIDGVWRCRTTFNCTESCPRGIQVTQAIQEVKRALMFAR